MLPFHSGGLSHPVVWVLFHTDSADVPRPAAFLLGHRLAWRTLTVFGSSISTKPHRRQRPSSVSWLYLCPIAIPGIPSVALGVEI